jgi:SAM-dependent methyltransferase
MLDLRSARDIHEERSKLWDSSLESHKKYINPETMAFDTLFTRERSCPACESDDNRKIFQKSGGTYVKCRDCEMIFLNPVFTDQALYDYYSRNHTVQSVVVAQDQEFYSSIYKKGLELISQHTKTQLALLDFGCSAGAFLDQAKKFGWSDLNGIELNSAEAQEAALKGHKVYNCRVESAQLNRKFDVITLWDVFEHLPDGAYYLHKFRELLNPDGMVFLQVPNGMSLAARIMQEKCNMYDGLEHVNLYSPGTISLLAERCGFEVVGIKSVIPELSVLNNYLHYESPYSGNMPSTDMFFNLANSDVLLNDLHGYKIQVILKVKGYRQ